MTEYDPQIINLLLGSISILLLFALFFRTKRIETLENDISDLGEEIHILKEFTVQARRETVEDASLGRREQRESFKLFEDSILSRLSETAVMQKGQFDALAGSVRNLASGVEKELEKVRHTVDEKLQHTLEKRLTESFELVRRQLENVHRGLGEMQTLAIGVGDLKRALTNVKSRGVWGEIQLGALLEELLTADQFSTNIATKPGSNDRVEFAVKLPGMDEDGSNPVWLPIDAKFPMEDYLRLLDAQESADKKLAEDAGKALQTRIKNEAKKIHDKYIDPPHTTDFALLYLPTEGLYAEVLRRPGLSDQIQRDYRVTLAGPTTLTALLNSLQIGFRTLVIQKRASEVWELLGIVRTEFEKYGERVAYTKKKIQEAAGAIDQIEVRGRAVERKLKNLDKLPPSTDE